MQRIRNWNLGLAVVAAALLSPAANAQNDRIIDDPTGWLYYYGASTSDISDIIADGFRPITIHRVSAGLYDTVFVHNSGDYQVTGADVTFGRSVTSLSNWLNDNNLRLLDVEAYQSGGNTFFSAIALPNSGPTAAPGWGWVANVTWTTLGDWLTDNPGLRLIDLDAYDIGGTQYYSAVAVPNSGNNAQGWWYFTGLTEAGIRTQLANNGARLVDLSAEGNTTFCGIMVSSDAGSEWFETAQTGDGITTLLQQTGGRLTAFHRYDSFGEERFAVALVDNLPNAQSRRMRDYMEDSGGIAGFTLKQVGGQVLAQHNPDFVFEPASTMKIVHGAYAVRECAQGDDNLNNNIFIRDTCNNNECPDNVQCSPGNEDLDVAIAEMLEQSDNNRTMEIELRYTRATLNAFVASRGMDATSINHRLGCLCGNPENQTSCTDLNTLYEDIANGSLFNQGWQDTLYNLMHDLDESGYGSFGTLSAVINEEAADTNLTAEEIAAFRDLVRFAHKAGGYGCNGRLWRADAGWASVPFKAQLGGGYLLVHREYVIAGFVYDSPFDSASGIVYSAKEEILREQIREALESWDDACTPPVIINEPDDLAVNVGEDATFAVVALGSVQGRTYQWQRRLGALWINLNDSPGQYEGTDTATMTVLNAQLNDANDFRCRVENGCGTDTSAVATLTVEDVPCPGDWNQSGSVTSADITAFLQDWFADIANGTDVADFNNSGSTTSADITAFLQAWFAGIGGGC
ncbi:MAG: serine hydrolase [Phycisphaerales bacterium]|nr:serine hydrolase [Phycisphaerales bacterium]